MQLCLWPIEGSQKGYIALMPESQKIRIVTV